MRVYACFTYYLEHRKLTYCLKALLHIISINIQASAMKIPCYHGHQDFLCLHGLHKQMSASVVACMQYGFTVYKAMMQLRRSLTQFASLFAVICMRWALTEFC